ncbi:MAG: esterase family protein [Verrucomicrobia bacterium]|nr:esterase family protein [Verrucomicrobiota bacterium]MBU1736374.1 esterase family protein [Verrucomicrobiota bacterium]MBU1857591.1 esterase family protein [Verrucomicrobiota bacterium]
MALMHCQFFSEKLGLSMAMNVIVPQATCSGQIGIASPERKKRYPALYLLHGLSDDHSIWCRRTSIERYAATCNLVIVMPEVHRSWYADMAGGGKYWTFISEELPALAEQFFPISPRRDDRFVAGLSMGGYGAFKLALWRPDKFSAAASLSGALDISSCVLDQAAQGNAELSRIFGQPDTISGSDSDLFALVHKAKAGDHPLPKLFQWCGTEDALYKANCAFRDHIRPLGFDYQYHESSGTHDWSCWDREIQRVLKWLPQASV